MRKKDFEYFAPKTVEEALQLLSQYGEDETKVIAGGQSLLILLKQGLITPQYLIDIKGISALNYIKADTNNGLRIGAVTPHGAMEHSPLIKTNFPVLAEVERRLADVEIRNWGTVGGNLCHADPIGEMAPALMVLNSQLKIASSNGERIIPIEDFSLDYFETVLQPDELLIEIQIAGPPPHTGTAYTKFVLVEGDQPIVGTAVAITLKTQKGECEKATVALNGAASTPLRVRKTEQLLAGSNITDKLIEEAAQLASEEASPISDIHASDAFKRRMIKLLLKQVIKEALARAEKT